MIFIREENSAYHTHWLVSLEVIRKSYSPPRSRRDKTARHRFNFRAFFGLLTHFLGGLYYDNVSPQCRWKWYKKWIISPLIRLYFKSRCLRKIKNEGPYFTLTMKSRPLKPKPEILAFAFAWNWANTYFFDSPCASSLGSSLSTSARCNIKFLLNLHALRKWNFDEEDPWFATLFRREPISFLLSRPACS